MDKIAAVSIVIPCYNEQESISETIDQMTTAMSDSLTFEIITVDDGSTDNTLQKLRELESKNSHLRVVAHDINRGYGAALKTGMRHASSELIAIIDADGTYPIADLPKLIEIADNYDMVVGARTGENVTYPMIRKIPKSVLKAWVRWIVKRPVPDINSGMRVFRKSMAQRFIRILPDGFSFTMTITISSMRNNYRVRFEPIDYYEREGRSKIKPFSDTLRFLHIIGRTGMYFAPIRILAPIIILLGLGVCFSAAYDVFVLENLTDKTVVLLSSFLNVSVFALIADMIDKRSDSF